MGTKKLQPDQFLKVIPLPQASAEIRFVVPGNLNVR
jgi:hypothetical protein